MSKTKIKAQITLQREKKKELFMMEQMYQVKNFSSYDEYDKIKVQG